MFAARIVFILGTVLLRQMLAMGSEELNESQRNGRYLDISSFLAGDSFRVAPFWKQWNAVFQINVQKNKHPHGGLYVVPASFLYYPPYAGLGGIGNQFTNGFPGLGNGFGSGHFPNSLQFDDNKSTAAVTNALMNKVRSDKLANDLSLIDLDDTDSISFRSDNDAASSKDEVERKTHKRDAKINAKVDGEVEAEVVEITESKNKPTPSTTVNASNESSSENTPPAGDSCTISSTESTIESTTVIIDEQTTTDASEMEAPATTMINEITTSESSISLQPIYGGYYYGGSAHNSIDSIYFTTTDPSPSENLSSAASLKPDLIHNSIDDRSDVGAFKPSIQYEYKNYRPTSDNHFIPIVGQRQIF